ncbi:MAG TPA: hypothetical protein VFL77_04175 [Solirubrobacterales bacterium]|nr:hypothetical protein [Solirubrobacterales bacterium]
MEAGASITHLSLRLAGLAALLCLCAAFLAAPAADGKQSGTENCGDIPSMYTWDVKAKKVACGQARNVAKTYDHRVAADLEHKWNLTIGEFRCVIVKIVYYGDTHRCAASGGREFSFRRGSR